MAGHAGQVPFKKSVNGVDVYYWPDGTPLSLQETTAYLATIRGNIAPQGPTNSFEDLFGGDGSVYSDVTGDLSGDLSGWEERQNRLIKADQQQHIPLLPQVVTPESPGGTLDTTQTGEDRSALTALLADLQQQAATGGGAWEQSLQKATANASAGAMALGQTQQAQTGGGYANALRNIGNAQGAAQQRAVGQGNILRAKSQQAAQQGIAGLTGALSGTDADLAATQSAINQQISDTNIALIKQADDANAARGSAMAGSFSKGGEVPGTPKVFGNDSRNDTVPAWLSPDEIVLPLSVTQSANPPQAAAEFVAALERSGGGAHAGNFADGGEAGDRPKDLDSSGLYNTDTEDVGVGNYVGNWAMPHIFGPIMYGQLRDKYAHPGAPSIENGGLLNTDQYNQTRGAAMGNAAQMALAAKGRGPSTVPQMAQNTTDANIEAALQAQAAGKGGNDLVGRTTAAQQDVAGQVAGMSAMEQQAGQQGAARAYAEQAVRDLAFSKAQQQAAWRNTMINAGLGIEQQNTIRNLFSGAGQAAAALSEIKGGAADASGDLGGPDAYSFDDSSSTGSVGDFDNTTDMGTNDFGDSGTAYAWQGGRIEGDGEVTHAAAMACGGRARGYAEGGGVDGLPPRVDGRQVVYQFDPATGEVFPVVNDAMPTMQAPESGTATLPWTKEGPRGDEPIVLPSAADQGRDAPMQAQTSTPNPAWKDIAAGVVSTVAPTGITSAIKNAPSDAEIDAQRMKLEEDKKRLGLVPAGAAPVDASTASLAAAKPPAAQGIGGYRPEVSPAQLDKDAAGIQSGIQHEAEAKAIAAEQSAAVLKAQGDSMRQGEMERKQQADNARAQSQEQLSRYEQAVSELKNVSTTVDPNRAWTNKSIPQKIMGIIGLALGAFGAGKDGINKAAVMMQEAAARDVEAQKAELQAKMQKGQQAVAGAQGAYAMARNIFQDEATATAAAKAAQLELVNLKLQEIAAGASSPQAKAQAERTAAENKLVIDNLKNQVGGQTFDRNLHRQVANAQMAAKGAGSGEVANALTNSRQKATHIANNAEKLIGLIDKVGTNEIAGTESGDMDLLSTALATDLAAMQDPKTGVRDAEMEKWSKVIFQRGWLQQDKTAKQQLRNIANYAKSRYIEDVQAAAH